MSMVDEDLASTAIRHAVALGAGYADVRYEYRESRWLLLEDARVEHVAYSRERGMGIRVLVNGAWGFYAISEPSSRDEVRDGVDKACRLARGASSRLKDRDRVRLADARAYRDDVIMPFRKDTRERFDELVALARHADDAMRSVDRERRLHRRSISTGYDYVEKMFVNSEGSRIVQRYMDTVMSISATAHEGSLNETVSRTEGGRGGLEMLAERADAVGMASRVASDALMLLNARPAKEERATVIMDPDFVALLTHEILGHPSEADRVLGYEMAWAGGAWWAGMLGRRIGSTLLNVSDDPTIEGSLGHYMYDDEGVKAGEKMLVRDGVLVGHMQSRETASIFNVEPNAGMRATGYEFMPLIRMACTYIKPGDHSLDEMVKGVKHGYMVYGQKVPSIDMYRYNWSISCQYARRIEGGEVIESSEGMLRDVIVMGNAPEFFSSIDACSKHYAIRPILNCGKGDPMQTLRMGNGGPYVRAIATVKSVAA
ncbi:MAG: TldD/PmbA family protein [Candidatus Nitrosocaldus sp.]|nr:TldD/PmbA family protein [Candidatus Nitrosocaldus sp.]MDW8000437.1 TldD/PmbA family protein [Candidatus Nitrosocaldus sp.]